MSSEICQTSNVKRFAEIVDGFWLLTISPKHSILDVCHGSEYASGKSESLSVEGLMHSRLR